MARVNKESDPRLLRVVSCFVGLAVPVGLPDVDQRGRVSCEGHALRFAVWGALVVDFDLGSADTELTANEEMLMRRGRERALRLAVGIAAAALLSGGSAWALSGGMPGLGHSDARVQPADVDDSTTTTSFDDSTTTTNVDDSTTTTSFDDSTTTTSFDDSTTTTTRFDGQTTTTVASCKPGWGYGDENHCHSGPPGKKKGGDDAVQPCKPGWGYGDKNHCHSGPPGQRKHD